MFSSFAKSAGGMAGGFIIAGAASGATIYRWRDWEVRNSAMAAAAEVPVILEASITTGEAVVENIAPKAAALIGATVAANVTASPTVRLLAATAAGTEAGLNESTARAGAIVASEAAVKKYSEFTFFAPAVTFAFAAIGAVAGYYVVSKFDELETEIANNKANNEVRFENIERMLSISRSSRSQTFIHNLDSMSHENLIDLLTCPITLELINDPVYMNDERFYERSAIIQYFLGNRCSPVRPDIILEDPRSVTTHVQVRDFLETNRERLSNPPSPPQEIKAKITALEQELGMLRSSSSATRPVGFLNSQSTAQPLSLEPVIRPQQNVNSEEIVRKEEGRTDLLVSIREPNIRLRSVNNFFTPPAQPTLADEIDRRRRHLREDEREQDFESQEEWDEELVTEASFLRPQFGRS